MFYCFTHFSIIFRGVTPKITRNGVSECFYLLFRWHFLNGPLEETCFSGVSGFKSQIFPDTSVFGTAAPIWSRISCFRLVGWSEGAKKTQCVLFGCWCIPATSKTRRCCVKICENTYICKIQHATWIPLNIRWWFFCKANISETQSSLRLGRGEQDSFLIAMLEIYFPYGGYPKMDDL